ncbi:MAG TPA: hypothetical protein VIH69_05675, partial [Dehalococcoidia bacterium]
GKSKMKPNNFVGDIPFMPVTVSEYRDLTPLMISRNRELWTQCRCLVSGIQWTRAAEQIRTKVLEQLVQIGD